MSYIREIWGAFVVDASDDLARGCGFVLVVVMVALTLPLTLPMACLGYALRFVTRVGR